MMKKAISLFLAVFVLCCATSALAMPTSITVTGNRNSDSTMEKNAGDTSMPCFRPTDTITFDLSGVTNGGELTVISYKNGSTPSDSTVQYMNQYTLSSTTQRISYKIRDLGASTAGKYLIRFNNNGSEVATFYYKVGKATAELVQSGGTLSSGYGTPYITHKMTSGTYNNMYSIGFIGKVTIASGDISLTDIGAHPGFSIKKGSGTPKSVGFGLNQNGVNNSGKTVSAFQETSQNFAGIEVGGNYSYIYGVTMYNIPEGTQGNITAQAVVDAN